jgi:hypothetical protein
MTNYEWLILLYGYFEKPTAPVAPNPDRLSFGVFILICSVLFLGIGIFADHITDVSLFRILGCIGTIASVYMILSYNVIKANYNNYLPEYTAKMATYEEDKANFEAERERVTQQRLTYDVYLDGQEVDINKILISNYTVVVNDNEQVIYLSTKAVS